MSHARMRNTLAGTGIAVALLLAGCSDGDSDTATPPTGTDMSGMHHDPSSGTAAPTRTDFDDADVTFLQMMYPHHTQAVDMAKLVPDRSRDDQLRTLADSVQQAQTPQLQQFTELLRSFGKPAPDTTGHEGMGHGMPGMMSPDRMTALQNATGAQFDRLWLEMMIDHHQGAIEMANTELAQGTNPDTKRLAQDIASAQRAEIDRMHDMLGQN